MKKVNISDMFPVTDDSGIERFLRKDAEYEDRKNQLSHMLLKAINDDPKKFMGAVVTCLFDPSYLACHRWPTIK